MWRVNMCLYLFSHPVCGTVFNIIMSKRKEKIFYAVGVGHRTGVYGTWRECKEQVDGLSNPKFRKFNTLHEAEQFVNRWSNTNLSICSSPNISDQSIAVSGSRSNIRSRAELESQESKGDLEEIVGSVMPNNCPVKKALEYGDAMKAAFFLDKIANCEGKIAKGISKVGEVLSFLTDIKNELTELKQLIPKSLMELTVHSNDRNSHSNISSSDFLDGCAINYVSEENGGSSNTQQLYSSRLQRIKADSGELDMDMESQPIPAKRKRVEEENSSRSAQENKTNADVKQGLSEFVPFTTDESEYVVVYTDGSCIHNGTENAKAGIGVWFDDEHPLNVSRPLEGVEPTNNNAEIQAARIACELALRAGVTKLKICTDSEFLINCVTKWVKKWKNNGWITEANTPVKNRAELEKLLDMTSRLSVRWEKVAAHSEIKGNEMADRLANEGAEYYMNQLRSVVNKKNFSL